MGLQGRIAGLTDGLTHSNVLVDATGIGQHVRIGVRTSTCDEVTSSTEATVEIFGPAAPIATWTEEAKRLNRADDTECGLLADVDASIAWM